MKRNDDGELLAYERVYYNGEAFGFFLKSDEDGHMYYWTSYGPTRNEGLRNVNPDNIGAWAREELRA